MHFVMDALGLLIGIKLSSLILECYDFDDLLKIFLKLKTRIQLLIDQQWSNILPLNEFDKWFQ